MALHNEYTIPTDAQFEAIGRVAANWAVLEFALELVILHLGLVPDHPGLALTNNLGIDNRLGALRTLIKVHKVRYRNRIIAEETLARLSSACRQIAELKDRRNKVIHYVWFRQSDERLFAHRFTTKPSDDYNSGP